MKIDIKQEAKEIQIFFRFTNDLEKTKKKYKYFAETYPTMFELIISDDKADMEILDKMLEMKSLIDKNVLSNEQADKEVGKILFDKFVPNNVKN